jgi:hypothetical protein
MKKWALLVVILYALILIGLTWPLGFLALKHDVKVSDLFFSKYYWSIVGVMVLGQAVLLVVPVQFASRRPVSRRSLVPAVLASGLMIGLLGVGFCLSVYEFTARGVTDDNKWFLRFFSGGGLLWLFWMALFYWLSHGKDPRDTFTQKCRFILAGSVLELLVAVPTHIVARQRDYCCAGFETFFGLAMGVAGMLFAFGPGVFFLFVDRWRKLHPEKDHPAPSKPL